MDFLEIDNLDLSFDEVKELTGIEDNNIKILEKRFNVKIIIRGNKILIEKCDDNILNKIKEVFLKLAIVAKEKKSIDKSLIEQVLTLQAENKLDSFEVMSNQVIAKSHTNKNIVPKSEGQVEYITALRNFDVVFGIGPAGSGKTYLAVVFAVSMLKANKIEKIILTRPAVEAGKSLGFLPGDLKEKIDPYLTPLYDALNEMLSPSVVELYIQKQIIEIAPLAYMRGRTLDNAFIILDEAQNTTLTQMKMMLTRLGTNSKMVITGDISQIDLKNNIKSGLIEARRILSNVSEIKFIILQIKDVVRHPIVKKIIEAFDVYEQEKRDAKQ